MNGSKDTDPTEFLPYGRQSVTEDDIAAVCEALRSDWLTTGPEVARFEEAISRFTGAEHGVAVSSGTAALHAAMFGIGIEPGDEVIVPPITFAATANCAVYQGATPVFADVDPDTLLIDPDKIEERITPRTRAIIAVDYAGQPCRYDALRSIADRNDLALVADGCHALGAEYKSQPVGGSLADLTVFSFHPVKHITTGEGGMATTDDASIAERMRRFRNHGISADHHKRAEHSTWYYEMVDLGHNYRLTDFQCALGCSQLEKLPEWLERRREIAARYDELFSEMDGLAPLAVRSDVTHAYHLYVVRIDPARTATGRDEVFAHMRGAGIGVNVHYNPVHLHPYYREHFGTAPGLCPAAEKTYERIISLPMFPAMKDEDIDRVTFTLQEALN